MNQGRALAVGSFVINFAIQTYGMLSKPNVKEVADAVCPSRALSRIRINIPHSSSCISAEPLRVLPRPLVHRRLLFHLGSHTVPVVHGQRPPVDRVHPG